MMLIWCVHPCSSLHDEDRGASSRGYLTCTYSSLPRAQHVCISVHSPVESSRVSRFGLLASSFYRQGNGSLEMQDEQYEVNMKLLNMKIRAQARETFIVVPLQPPHEIQRDEMICSKSAQTEAEYAPEPRFLDSSCSFISLIISNTSRLQPAFGDLPTPR